MTITKKLEFAGGFATLLLGIAAPFCRLGITETFRNFSSGVLLDALVLFILPGLLVGIGSYLHAIAGKSSGFFLILIGGAFLIIMMFIHLFGGVFYLFGLWGGLIIVSEALMGLVTLILSAVVRTTTRRLKDGKQPA
ncbi:MAG TPA: hypothetical protein VIF64_14565 [Pyrinomonadaceae bacterium]|jgi:hypothetical protein